MGNYQQSITIDVPPALLFAYLADVRNLPKYMPRLTSAEPAGGNKVDVTAHIDPHDAPEQEVAGRAWVNVVEDGKRLEWGATGPHDYRGELQIGPGDTQQNATLVVELHTERTEGDQVDQGLKETLSGIKQAAENH
ncbi:SRPBCC family protein [Amycolatopsis sp. cmx-11-12]|uniref:SRPBCC family protein n=1 Tax=Amycolatopsis sp. cmx-11-12 TaxID=2785795 RepID=UPI003917EC9E